MKLTAPRGTNDILPDDVKVWQYVEEVIRDVCNRFGYSEVRVPIFEHTEVFQRGIGEVTDIVEKEMYTFIDKGGRSMTLRPEGTAAVVRAYLEHKLHGKYPLAKLYYLGPMFRYERPQAGRYRQFHQFGVEALGSSSPFLDAEVIDMASTIYTSLGVKDFEIKLNTIGCPKCRAAYQSALRTQLKDKLDRLCKNCRNRYDRNPMRILDCKEGVCKEITESVESIDKYLCDECKSHFAQVKECLDALEITYTIDKRLVRGFDYYTKTVFEIVYKGLGAQDAIGGGGRYDGLVEEYGGPHIPAVGYAAGLERVLLTLKQSGNLPEIVNELDVYISCIGGDAISKAFTLLSSMRKNGIAAEMDYSARSLKSQMKSADKLGARYVVILGLDEIEKGSVTVRAMNTGQQEEVPLTGLEEYIASKKRA